MIRAQAILHCCLFRFDYLYSVFQLIKAASQAADYWGLYPLPCPCHFAHAWLPAHTPWPPHPRARCPAADDWPTNTSPCFPKHLSISTSTASCVPRLLNLSSAKRDMSMWASLVIHFSTTLSPAFDHCCQISWLHIDYKVGYNCCDHLVWSLI